MNDFYLIFNILTLINVLIPTSILLFRKDSSAANKILALIILVPALNFINNIIIFSGVIFNFPYFLFLFQGSVLLFSPLVILYVNLIREVRFQWFTAPNVFTLLIFLLDSYFAYSFSRLTGSGQRVYLQGLSNDNYPKDMYLLNLMFFANMFAYFIFEFSQIRKQSDSKTDTISNRERISLKYIQRLIVFLILINVFLGFSYLALPTPIVEYFGIPLVINIMCLFILVQAFNNGIILFDLKKYNSEDEICLLEPCLCIEESGDHEMTELKVKNELYKLTDIEMNENYLKIKEYLDKTKPYLDPNINLTKFSSELNSSSHIISMTINCKFEMTFFDLINSLRVSHAKMQLLSFDKNHLTIESVGLDSGFNSMSSFYRAFKKFADITPGEFIKTRQKEFSSSPN